VRRALRDAATLVVKAGRLVNLDDTLMSTMQLPGPRSDDELLAYSRGFEPQLTDPRRTLPYRFVVRASRVIFGKLYADARRVGV
jgi:hypothetical protein